MVSRCKRLINIVKLHKPKTRAGGLSQKGNGAGTGTVVFLVMGKHNDLPADRADLTCRVVHEERGKPDAPPSRGRRTARGAVGAAGRGR